uniref:Uncharacterized protein n=1 Tax=Candidatus Kentrum sp. LFY TaxID=2126342 RepID=A0A450V447_9GAMM|nr:MAG: hypothetical protein BECKLFY1418A_GA0070994_11013 [Candidatus Kentron sp. LFY]
MVRVEASLVFFPRRANRSREGLIEPAHIPSDALVMSENIAIRLGSHVEVGNQIVQGTQNRDHDPTQQNAQDNGHGRLDEGLQSLDGFPNVAIIEIAHILEGGIQCPGTLPHPQHAQHQRWK